MWTQWSPLGCGPPQKFSQQWPTRWSGVPTSGIDHYLDDFIIISPPHPEVCGTAIRILEEECSAPGVTLAPEKKEGPSTKLPFLGIDIDTVTGHLYLPADKLTNLRQMVDHWSHRRSCQRRELGSLVVTLQHAAKVIRPGRTFLRTMINLLKGRRSPHHYIRLNKEFRADLAWWKRFAGAWNELAFFPPPPTQPRSSSPTHRKIGAAERGRT